MFGQAGALLPLALPSAGLAQSTMTLQNAHSLVTFRRIAAPERARTPPSPRAAPSPATALPRIARPCPPPRMPCCAPRSASPATPLPSPATGLDPASGPPIPARSPPPGGGAPTPSSTPEPRTNRIRAPDRLVPAVVHRPRSQQRLRALEALFHLP